MLGVDCLFANIYMEHFVCLDYRAKWEKPRHTHFQDATFLTLD